MRRSIVLFAITFQICIGVLPAAAASSTVARSGDASIAHDEATGTWTLSAGGAALALTIDATRDFALTALTTPSGKSWPSGLTDTQIKVGGQLLGFGNRAAGFTYGGTTFFIDDNNRLRLDATYDLNASGLRITRHYVIVSGAPAFETWTTYLPTTGAPTLSDLGALQISVPNGTVHTLTGLQGDSADVAAPDSFTLATRALTNGQRMTIGAQGRSSEQTVPWIAIDGAQDEFFAALMWSGAWSLTATRSGSSIALAAGLASMTTTARASIDGPHVVFGAAAGGLPAATAALRSYVLDGIRAGRPLTPLVTYNTWFAYGTAVDEPTLRSTMDYAAAIGTELFVIDAGWYTGAGAADIFDFDSGLGSWQVDPSKFPNGLAPLRNHAHALGMKFGLWVEPERINLAELGASGLDEQLLATSGGNYGSDHAGQICLANAAARQWVLDKLTALIDDAQPDYLKWDNNMWVNCDRDGHEHGAADGNFAHVNGLYDILSTLRAQYPNLMIENVSGGGNRLDVGMLRYSDVAWMDDRTAPSSHVRHNVEGLSAVFPPAYLLSFVTDHAGEPLHGSPDLSLYMRSRMLGALGLCFRTDDFSEGDTASLAHEVAIYRSVRDTLSVAAAALLTTQASDDGPAWDVLQETTTDGTQAVLSAYQSDTGVDKTNAKPTGLDRSATYEVVSVDTGVLGTATGADLMSKGIDIIRSPNTAAHILTIRAVR